LKRFPSAVAPLQRFTIRVRRLRWRLAASSNPTSSRVGRPRVTIGAAVSPDPLAWDRRDTRLPTRTTHHPIASPLRRHLRFCLRLDVVVRDRPATPKQSADLGTADESVTTGPVLALGRTSGTSPEVWSPSAHVSRVALSGAAGLRTIPLRRFAHRRARAFRDANLPSAASSPVRFFAPGAGSSVALLARRTCGTGRSIVPQTCRAIAARIR